ncbi:hypothetical protein [Pseudomonas asiatica]|uniref:hypothetical protein n=1 Tax=Pseudomonas asiatica TaxID=2219225 RepID=UPI003B95108A
MPAPDNLTVQTPGEPLAPAATEQTSTTSTTSTEAKEPEYTAKHNGGGRWRIWAATTDDWFSDFVVTGDGAKDLAQAEADRLNAGGEPFTKPADPAPEAPAAAAAAPATAEQIAPGRAVLTAEGWLVGELPANYSKE